jgi:hypothetical protein
MDTVMIYGFRGEYLGKTEYEYNAPEIGAVHKCMLFLSQNEPNANYEDALAECKKYGFGNVQITGAGPLKVDVLTTDQFSGFTVFYEEALNEGSALVYYPNA